MARAKLPGGQFERGAANQRHFARAVNKMDGVRIVCSYSQGDVSLSVDPGVQTPEIEGLAQVWGGEIESDGGLQYTSGNREVLVSF